MTVRFLLPTSAALFIVAAVATALVSAGVKVPLEEVPAPAVRTVKERFPKAEIRFVDRESKTRFEFAMKEGDRLFDVEVNSEGKLLNIKEEIAGDKLPAAVKEALQKKYPDAKVVEAEKVIAGDGKDAKETYELLIKTNKGKEAVEIDAKGKFVGEKD
jgi:hypothetical protein